jgi:hypothetical protein
MHDVVYSAGVVKEDVSEGGLKAISAKYSKRLLYEDQGVGPGLVKLGFDENKKHLASSMAECGSAQRRLEDMTGTSSSANVSLGGSVSSEFYRSESSESLQQHKDKASPHLSSIFPYDDCAAAARSSSEMPMNDSSGWTQVGKHHKHIDVSVH